MVPSELPAVEPPLFQSVATPPPRPPARIPHFGHLVFLLLVLAPLGLLATGVLMAIAIHKHLFGASSAQQAVGNIHYILGSEGLLYFFTFAACLLIFPLFWHESLFAGLQWNGATAVRLRWWLFSAAFVCFLLAVISGEFMPSPTNTPIEKVFRTPGAAWLLFAFGVTLAPFFEEMLFRGFLLPSLCTAYDWIAESITSKPPLPLDEHGHPQWSLNAMFVGSIATQHSLRGYARGTNRTCVWPISSARGRQHGAVRCTPLHALARIERPRPRLVQFPALLADAYRDRRLPPPRQDVKEQPPAASFYGNS